MLEAGAPVNCRVTEDASTPLHKACAGSKTGHLIAVKLLLASNADVHALNKWRETPLLTAANHGQAGAVDSLLKAGADPCKCTDTGWSPLSIAAYKGHDDVVRLLLEEGAPTEEADPTLSALLQAATKGLPDTVELLLKHGADHTVTTKKGDTALSILVEQNLIDAAVDMVTEYNASIPRCSRDRKKVQRARLLINLRIKQRQREGKDINLIESDGEDDDEIDKNENPDLLKSTSSAVPDEEDNENLDRYEEIYQIVSSSNKNKNNKNPKGTAEQQAKAAEEALLLELELEDAERQKQESEASKKSAKKRKKKERERQQKKEQEEKRLAEEKEREDKIRTEREEREAKERAERERIMAAKRQEEDEERKRAIERQKFEQQQRDEQRKKELLNRKQQQESLSANSSVSSTEKKSKQSSSKPMKRQSGQVTSRPATSIATVNSSKSTKTKPSGSVISNAALPILSKLTGKNRGWETKPIAPQVPSPAESKSIPSKLMGGSSRTISDAYHRSSNTFPSDIERSQPLEPLASVASSSPFASFSTDTANLPATGPLGFNLSETILNGLSAPPSAGKGVEVPAVALFRRNKVSELLQRCAIGRTSSEALGAISETTMKKVLYRWMVRATHESTNYLDCIIPSWTDFEKLSAFFQRQFISENRKGITSSSLGIPMVSIEALKEAGSNIAILCYNLAKEVADFRGRVEEQLSPDWNDAIIGMEASEMLRNGSDHGASIVLDWAGRAQVLLPSFTFRKLQQRYTGLSGRFLSAVFSTKIRYETQKLITSDTLMDFQLPSHTLSVLSLKASVTAEVWSDPLSTMSGNLFWGQFFDTDEAFGGLAPFSKDESSDEILVRHGGSVVATIPLDNMVASRYMHRIIDILDLAENSRIPLSFAIFLRSECFLDGKVNPSFHDLCVLEPRLRERSELISSVKELAPQQHGYFCMKSDEFEPSETGSLLAILQNLSGKNHYGLSDMVVGEILRSLGTNPELVHSDGRDLSIMSEMSFSAPEFVPASSRNKDLSASVDAGNNMFHHSSDYGQSQGPTSPMAHQSTMLPDFGGPIGDFIGFGGVPIGNAFSMQSHASSRSSRPRGRLFDLVDDGEDETADVVSGMLGNLNMDDLFSQQPNRNSNGEIDIEAISLMGIGGPGPTSSSSSGGGLQPRRGPFGY